MKIKDIMTKDVALVSPDTKLKEAARLMREADSGFLPVGQDDHLVGTITDRDITVRSVAEGQDPNVATVGEAMSQKVVYCFEDQETAEAAEIMSEKQIRRLPILNRDKRLVGVISLGDIATGTREDDIVGQTVEDVSEPTGKPRQM